MLPGSPRILFLIIPSVTGLWCQMDISANQYTPRGGITQIIEVS